MFVCNHYSYNFENNKLEILMNECINIQPPKIITP